ncbi:MAG: phage/plasmid primase, P4 family [Methylococcaceae bacterium]
MSLEQKRDDYLGDISISRRPNLELLKAEPTTEIKRQTLDKLLRKIVKVNYFKVCESLGWLLVQDKNGSKIPPTQSNHKVAIINQLMKVAKENNWHLALDAGLYYIYTGSMWISLDKDELKNFLKDVAIKQSYPQIKALDSRFINNLYDQAIQDGFFVDKGYSSKSMINLNNCTLELDSGGVKVKPFDYRDFLTHQLPFDYKEKATNEIFTKYLNEVLPDKDTQRTLQETCGYLFIRGLKLEKIFFLYGLGANGKSVLFEVLNGLLGDENISHYSLQSLTDTNGYFRAKIKDKIVNYGTDIKLSKIDAGMFKTLASGEPVEARLPYGQPFTMSKYAKLIFNVNRLDNANIEHTHGFYRRILIIPFNKKIHEDKQDKKLHEKILVNKEGVLNWIIKGAKKVIKNEEIFISNECERFKSKFIRDNDSVALFMDDLGYESCEFSFSYLSALYPEYKWFCANDGYRSLGKHNFGKRLEALGINRKKDGHNKDGFEMKKT